MIDLSDMETAPELTSLYQLMPPLIAWDYDQLKASIAEYFARHGRALWPGGEVVVDDDGRVLDGHHRMRACSELGLVAPTRVAPDGWNDDDKWLFALRSNVARRHLTIEQRRSIMRAYIARYPAATVREIANAAGASTKLARSVQDEMAERGATPHRVHRDPNDAIVSETQTHESRQTGESPEPYGEDEERSPLQVADHKRESWVEIRYGYGGPPDEDRIHVRPNARGGTLPYAYEWERCVWSSGRMVLTAETPMGDPRTSQVQSQVVRVFEDIGRRGIRQMLSDPLRTMR